MSDYLAAKPSILEGIARIMDLGGTMQVYRVYTRNDSSNPDSADYLAIYQDFAQIGNDMRSAIGTIEKEISPLKDR